MPYLLKALNAPLQAGFVSLDASRPWIVYWICHSLDLMGYDFTQELKLRIVNTLGSCQSDTGGFGGGPGQMAHLATTYAAVNTLCILQAECGYSMVNRKALYNWLMSLKQPDGSFCMHWGGEIDVRGVYCALSVASLLGLDTDELKANCDSFILMCQTYEGGMGSLPGVEAHGGYTFCGLAAMELLGKVTKLNFNSMALWATLRQMPVEGGFQGRTNKLVDGCYSFWQGGIFPILKAHMIATKGDADSDSSSWEDLPPLAGNPDYLADYRSLQEYILFVAQPSPLPDESDQPGGLRDKPNVCPDFYHTCYNLSGLSVAQHDYTYDANCGGFYRAQKSLILGERERNELKPTHPVYNVCIEHVQPMKEFFYSQS